ncbi:MAG: GTPase Era [Polyangiales bacterium]|nr:GTPase Era [Myxococcales bacterium]
MSDPSTESPRAGRVTILGRPNVGKSTLLNALVGQTLAIATPRPGTTRSNLLGVHMRKDPPTQIAFVDTPGVGRAQTALHRVLVEQAEASVADVDAVVLLLSAPDCRGADLPPADQGAFALAMSTGRPIVLALNKVDRVKDKEQLLPLLDTVGKRPEFSAIVPISATKGTNLDALVSELRNFLPEGLAYDEDFLTDRPERYFVRELVREAAIRHTREEVPYGVAVLLDEYSTTGDRTHIEATVVVEKESHKKIVVGAGGSMIRTIGTEARKAIETFVGRKVVLKLWVKVVEGWTEDPRKVRELALGENE